MMKLVFLMMFLLMSGFPLKADEVSGGDQEFINQLDSIKSPFEDGLPKPVVAPVRPEETQPGEAVSPLPPPKPVILPVKLPDLKLQGVIVGADGEVHEAIINDQVVSLFGMIKGARLVSITKQGVMLIFKGKKFFLRIT